MKKLLAFIDRSWLYSVIVFTVFFIVMDIVGSLVGFTEVSSMSLLKSVGLGVVVGVLMYWVRRQDKELESKKKGE